MNHRIDPSLRNCAHARGWTRSLPIVAFVSLALGWHAGSCRAAEGADKAEKGKTKKAPSVSKQIEAGAEGVFDGELMKSLLGKSEEAAEGKNPLDEAVNGMRAAQRRIEGNDTGRETRSIQDRVIKDLDAVIEQLKKRQKQPPQNSNANQQNQEDKSQSNQGADEQRQQQEPQNSTKQQQETEAQKRQKERDKAQDSTEDLNERANRKATQTNRERLKNDVWGHLPPAVRQELLNVYSEKFLPQYEELIQRYYEALAERNKRQAP